MNSFSLKKLLMTKHMYINPSPDAGYHFDVPHPPRPVPFLQVFNDDAVGCWLQDEIERVRSLRRRDSTAQPRWKSPFDFYDENEIEAYEEKQMEVNRC